MPKFQKYISKEQPYKARYDKHTDDKCISCIQLYNYCV